MLKILEVISVINGIRITPRSYERELHLKVERLIFSDTSFIRCLSLEGCSHTIVSKYLGCFKSAVKLLNYCHCSENTHVLFLAQDSQDRHWSIEVQRLARLYWRLTGCKLSIRSAQTSSQCRQSPSTSALPCSHNDQYLNGPKGQLGSDEKDVSVIVILAMLSTRIDPNLG
jgi:hypothetical protein